MIVNRGPLRRVLVRGQVASLMLLLALLTAAGCSGPERADPDAGDAEPQRAVDSSMPPTLDRPAPSSPDAAVTEIPAAVRIGVSEPRGPGGAGLLESLPLDPRMTASVEGSPNLGGRSFIAFGHVYVGADGPQRNPQPTFWAPLGTPVLAPVSGVVVAIPVVWSGDDSVMIAADGDQDWVWEVEHVIDVAVAVGDHVRAGQTIAVVSDYDVLNTPGVGLVELGLLHGGNPPQHHCPFLYVAAEAESSIAVGLELLVQADAERLGLALDPTSGVAGCVTTEPIEG